VGTWVVDGREEGRGEKGWGVMGGDGLEVVAQKITGVRASCM
jgi:hypothetical protein